MPLFTAELNRLADSIGESDLTIYLHTAASTDANPDNGRTNAGGGAYENGKTVAAADISAAADGDIRITADIAFGRATADVGTVTNWSAYRGTHPVGYGTLPETTIEIGDYFTISANTLRINGSTT